MRMASSTAPSSFFIMLTSNRTRRERRGYLHRTPFRNTIYLPIYVAALSMKASPQHAPFERRCARSNCNAPQMMTMSSRRSLRSLLCALGSMILTGAALAQTPPVSRATYVDTIRRAALERGVPPDLAEAVAQIESGFDPSAVGTVGEVGLMQVRPQTAAMLGFAGLPSELARPDQNVRYGVAYLAGAWRQAQGNVCRALMKYRAGHNAEVMSPLSVTYCQRARAYLASLGSPLASGIGPIAPLPATAATVKSSAARLPTCTRGTPACSRMFWAAHEARIRRMVAQLHAGKRSKS